jgi:hypothetical protein
VIQYISAVCAFIAVVVGVRGHTWDSKRRRFSWIGWTAIAVGAATTLATIVGAYRDHAKLDWQAAQREKVRHAAQADLREAVHQLISPFGILYENAHFKFHNISFDPEKFHDDTDYMIARLADPQFRGAWTSFDLRKSPEHPDLCPPETWGQFFSNAAERSSQELDMTVSKYSAYLNANELLLIHDLQTDEFFRLCLRDLPALVKANEYLPAYPVEFAFRGPEEYAPYLRFVDKVGKLARALPTRDPLGK